MKFFVTGLHSSGKQEVINILENMNVKCGKLFTNLDNLEENVYNKYNYQLYSNDDINTLFENEAYVFIHEFPSVPMRPNDGYFYEGLSKYTLDQNDVFILSPDQLLSVVQNSIKDDICFIWLDNTKENRETRYYHEKRLYNYHIREEIEKHDLNTYVKMLYSFPNSRIIYFNDEVPARVATIIATMIKHPDTVNDFVKNFD